MNRRDLLKCGGVASLLPLATLPTAHAGGGQAKKPVLQFVADGLALSPPEYVEVLGKMTAEDPAIQDRYGSGGAVERLEAAFVEKIVNSLPCGHLPFGVLLFYALPPAPQFGIFYSLTQFRH